MEYDAIVVGGGIAGLIDTAYLSKSGLRTLLCEITPEDKIKEFEESGDIDFSHEVPGLARYRVNFFRRSSSR